MDYTKLAASATTAKEAQFREDAMLMLNQLLLKVDELSKQVAKLEAASKKVSKE